MGDFEAVRWWKMMAVGETLTGDVCFFFEYR
jgi:hypothetical protein